MPAKNLEFSIFDEKVSHRICHKHLASSHLIELLCYSASFVICRQSQAEVIWTTLSSEIYVLNVATFLFGSWYIL